MEFDLNLIRVLVAVSDHGSISKAARALGMSQPGLSTAIGRARKLLGDPLFVRTAEGILPTERAQRAIDASRSILDLARRAILEQPEFDPAKWVGRLRLAMQDVSEAVLLPRLLSHLHTVAPGATIQCMDTVGPTLSDALADGTIDLAIGYYPDLDSQAIERQRLYVHTYACIVRKEHPCIERGLDLRAYRELGHVIAVSSAAAVGALRKTLAGHHIERTISLELSHILSVPAVIESTDLVATVPLAVAESFSRNGSVVVLPLPFDPPCIQIQQYWHQRYDQSKRSAWLRSQISTLFNDQSDRWQTLEELLYGPRRSRVTIARNC